MISIGELEKKTTHSPHHISTPPSSISFLNLFQAPSHPFQLPEVSSQQQEWIGRSCPKMLFRSFPARRSLTKLGFGKCHEFTGHIGRKSYGHDGHIASCGLRCTTEDQKVYRTCCFCFPFQIQPSHLKGTWEIPHVKNSCNNNDDKRIANYKSFLRMHSPRLCSISTFSLHKHHRNFSGQNAGGDGHQVQMLDRCHLINPVKAPKHEAGDLHHQRSASPDWDG